MNRIPLTKLKLVWRDQIFHDQRLKPTTLKLGYFLADYITLKDSAEKYRKQGRIFIWPSQETLRERTFLAPATISNGISQLIQRGHLKKLKRGNQVTGSNKYRLLIYSHDSGAANMKFRDAPS